MNTSDTKTPATSTSSHTKYDYIGRLSINKDIFCVVSCTILFYDLKPLLTLQDFTLKVSRNNFTGYHFAEMSPSAHFSIEPILNKMQTP